MNNIEQFTRELMLAHDIDYETAQYRASQFYKNIEQETPSVLNGWISVKQQPMPVDEQVLFFTHYEYISLGILNDGYVAEINYNGSNIPMLDVTHWKRVTPPTD